MTAEANDWRRHLWLRTGGHPGSFDGKGAGLGTGHWTWLELVNTGGLVHGLNWRRHWGGRREIDGNGGWIFTNDGKSERMVIFYSTLNSGVAQKL